MQEVHNLWDKAVKWVWVQMWQAEESPEQGTLKLLKDVEVSMNELRWRERMTIPGAHGQTQQWLSLHLLSDSGLMRTDHINMFFAHISNQVENLKHAFSEMVIVETLIQKSFRSFSAKQRALCIGTVLAEDHA
jgi:hypothetical protein